MTRRNFTVGGFGAFLQDLPPQLKRAIVKGLKSSAMRGKGIVVEEIERAKPYPAVNVGELRNSVRWRPTKEEGGGAVLSVEAPHAAPIEEGTRAFWPPQEPLRVWAVRKFGVSDREARQIAFLVARKISKHGIAPRHYFAKAMKRLEDQVVPMEIKREVDRLL